MTQQQEQYSGILSKIKSRLDRNRLGELLVAHKLISPEDLRHALKLQKDKRETLGKILIAQGLISKFSLHRVLAEQMALRFTTAAVTMFISLSALNIKPARADSGAENIKVASASFAPRIKPIKAYPTLFGSREKRSSNLKAFTKWTDVVARFDRVSSSGAVKDWEAKIARFEGLDLEEKVRKVNALVNQQKYIEDKDRFQKSDYWATPAEFFGKGGDCEDFAIAKYVSLKKLGVPESRMRVAIVMDEWKNIPHAILIVYTDGGPMILDNQVKEARWANDVNRYRPIYSINQNNWWRHVAS